MTDEKRRIEVEDDNEADSQKKGKNWEEVAHRDLANSTKKRKGEEDSEGGKSGSEGTALEYASYQKLESQLTEAEQRAQKNYDNWLRTQAEYDNFRKRMERDLAHAHKFSVEKLVVDLIPVLDSLDQGLETKGFQAEKSEIMHQLRLGMELTYKMLLDTLIKYDVRQLNPEGDPFNPEHHEAVSMQEDEDLPPNTVLKVLQKGYLLHNRLIRPARVLVSK